MHPKIPIELHKQLTQKRMISGHVCQSRPNLRPVMKDVDMSQTLIKYHEPLPLKSVKHARDITLILRQCK